MIQSLVHYFLHFGFPLFIALVVYPKKWKRVYFILLLTLLVDLDHLWAEPIYDPDRCSINYHFLHSYYAIIIYSLAMFYKPTRIIALGLLLHMLTDSIDCIWMYYS